MRGRERRLTHLVGSKDRFALELGERSGGLRRVDVWLAGQHLTCDDDMAYVPQLLESLRSDRAGLDSVNRLPPPFPGLPPEAAHRRLQAEDGERREQWWFLRWGPTTDNVVTYLFRDGERLVITAEFWRDEHLQRHPEHAGAVFAAEIPAEELATVLQDAAAALGQRWSSSDG